MSKSKSWLTAEEESYLKQFDSRNRSIRDNVRLVAQRHSSGLYVCGSAGTSKTYTVTSILEEEEASYEVVAGHITGVGLFRTFQKNPHSTIVLDDVTAIFKNEVGKQILLSALGKGKNGERWVGYHKASMQERCLFFGGVIAISNLMLGCDPVSIALQSRVNAIEYIPEQEEIRAFIKHIAESKGFDNMTIEESKELASFVITISLEEGKALDLRSITKSAEVYVASKSGTLESTWQDLVRNN
ncbi:MAG: hypothetical protein K2X93_29605, partial [Candidatus Obscuribacterales bacterium]|nr:hypothetical protein [Candidatus Obscuribacterales bacterium]